MIPFDIKEPKTGKDFEQYYLFRWKILRKPYKQPKGSERDELENKSKHIMITDTVNNIIGVGRIHQIRNEFEEIVSQIRYMAVSNEYRNYGLGSKILKNLEEYAYKKGIKKIILHARESALEFYIKNGYDVVEKSHILYNSIQHWKMIKINRNN